jgi:hypothetical protein
MRRLILPIAAHRLNLGLLKQLAIGRDQRDANLARDQTSPPHHARDLATDGQRVGSRLYANATEFIVTRGQALNRYAIGARAERLIGAGWAKDHAQSKHQGDPIQVSAPLVR